jgi:alpha-beta hydrolase superfamily lysophospholipase
MRAILVHGMGRTPASMALLALRLRAAGMRPALFGYSVTFERFGKCSERLHRFVEKRRGTGAYVLVGHSLGSVLLRSVLPKLGAAPAACFFITPPTRACRMARRFAPTRLYRALAGEMGQLLADEKFMSGLPTPSVPTRIYAGTSGPRGRWSPFGNEVNDGLLALDEMRLASVPMVTLPAWHTFATSARAVARDIVATVRALGGEGRGRVDGQGFLA